MRAMRIAALAVAVAGAVAGGVLDRVTMSRWTEDGGPYLLAADFHVHAFPGDGALPPWEVAREARRRGLDVIAITNHNQLLGARAAAALTDGVPIVLVGQEITAPTFHMAAVGLSHAVDWRLSAAAAIDAVHAQGGIAIAAHPTSPSWTRQDDEALARLDGTEVAHPVVDFKRDGRQQLETFRDRVAQVNPGVAPIGSSDFHFSGGMGRYRTYVLARELRGAAVLDAVRDGRTVASDPRGQLIGNGEDVALVERHLSRHPPLTGPSTAQRLAAALVLAALAAFVVLR